MPVRRMEDLDDKDPEKQLYLSRKNREKEFQKIERDLHRLKRGQKPQGWK